MNFLVICLLGFVVATQAAISQERKIIMRGFSKMCSESAGLSDEIVSNIRVGDYDSYLNDPKANKFALCMLEKMGIINDKGDMTKDIVLSFFDTDEQQEISDAMDTCLKTAGGKIDDKTASAFAKCYHDKYPDQIVV